MAASMKLWSRADTAVKERLPDPVGRVFDYLRDEDVLMISAGLAFYALVSVAPLVIIALWATSMIVGDGAVQRTGEELARLAPGKLGLDKAFTQVAQTGTDIGVWAVAAALWPATAYGSGLARAFNRVSDRARELPGLKGRALAFLLMAALQIVVLAGLAVALVGPRLLGEGLLAAVAGWVSAAVVGFLSIAAMTGLIYRVYDTECESWTGIAQAAATVAAGISLLSLGYVVFLRLGTDFEQRYASSGLAAVVLLAGWLFLANALLLVGYRLARERDRDSRAEQPAT
ncbi:MAG: YihY/virulence factor BrkB family protein [Thermoleophilaceae bacterium]|nr:YihY/virulence factor BrkB family protein [Thermoleophilaceae bacterium]